MKQCLIRKLLFVVVATVLLAAMVCGTASCNSANKVTETTTAPIESPAVQEIGEGKTAFAFSVTHLDGSTKHFTVKTDAETVGAALVGVGLISGEPGPYGLYVKTVDGEMLDYDTHKKYWAFYEDGTIAMAGVDATEIKSGVTYAFRAE